MRNLFARLPSHSTVAAYLALFVAFGGVGYAAATIGPGDIKPDAVRSKHIDAGNVKKGDLAPGAVNGKKVEDGALSLADTNIGQVTMTISYPALNAGQCAFVAQDFAGVDQADGVLAYTGSGWDNRVMIDGVESGGASTNQGAALHICNHTAGTNLGAGSGPVTFLIF